ncbi:MAG: hypothetical protein HZB92_06395 [Euryarchaeota archaeon]|nr:hypothetical protein [Euryarchaeota archaeon]
MCRVADIYKLLFQSCMGPEHAITNERAVKNWLSEEWRSIDESEEEPLYDDITINHPVFRLNLAPAKARGIPQGRVLRAFLALGEEFEKDRALLEDVWTAAAREMESGGLAIGDADGLAEFNRLVALGDFPAVRHSMEYAEAYKPAYRLVGNRL